MAKKGGLGKGLEAIFADNDTESSESAIQLRIDDIEPNRDQPRKSFNKQSLANLADSISQHGLLQPLLVKPIIGGGYSIIAGERRWRACKMAGLKKIPAIVRDLSDVEVTQCALIENLQREDLKPLEEAMGYDSLMKTYGFTQEQVSQSVGKSRSAVANSLRLLNLPESIQILLNEDKISAGQARAILAFPENQQEFIAKKTVSDGLTVRDLEKLSKTKIIKTDSIKKDIPFYNEAEITLHQYFGRKIKIKGNNKKGVLQIEFNGQEDLKKLIDMIDN